MTSTRAERAHKRLQFGKAATGSHVRQLLLPAFRFKGWVQPIAPYLCGADLLPVHTARGHIPHCCGGLVSRSGRERLRQADLLSVFGDDTPECDGTDHACCWEGPGACGQLDLSLWQALGEDLQEKIGDFKNVLCALVPGLHNP